MRVLRLLHAARIAAGTALVTAGAGVAASSGCTTQPTESSLHALEQSGRVSFVCLGDPTDPKSALPLEQCRNIRSDHVCDYAFDSGNDDAAGTGGGGGSTTGTAPTSRLPHLYALVTQTYRGEVAVIDLTTADSDYLVDQDPTVPGPSFLPVGAQPVGIVSTPGSTATFVTVAEVGREGIYAIPSQRLLRSPHRSSGVDCSVVGEETPPPPDLSTWPSCSLPATPGEPILLHDPADDQGFERASCDDPYEDPDAEITDASGEVHPEWRDLRHPHGVLRDEGAGRQKLAVPLPSLGGIAIIDAQKLLDGFADPPAATEPPPAEGTPSEGVFAPCPIDRWIALDSEVPAVSPPPPPQGAACVSPAPAAPAAVTGKPMPAGMAHAEGTLYVADLALPLIHRLAVSSPCEPTPLPSLLPFSLEEPERVVTTSRVAVTPRPTAKLERYLYANDVDDGTVMVFDVSDTSTTLTPLVRSHPEWTPTQARDRLQFFSAPRDILVVSRDIPLDTPGTAIAPEGTFCDPNPAATACTAGSPQCDPGTLYRTASDFGAGAGPYKLRGTFAYVLLTNGSIQIVDIEDLDAPCRGPNRLDARLGCELPTCTKGDPTCPANFTCPGFDPGAPDDAVATCTQVLDFQKTTCDPNDNNVCPPHEASCGAVTPNTLRSAEYILDDAAAGANRPGLSELPSLEDPSGTHLDPRENTAAPVLHVTVSPDGALPEVSVNGVLYTPGSNGATTDGDNLVAMNLETPRAHTNESWTVTFEGPLPRLGAVAAELDATSAEPGIRDAAGRYCQGGVQSRTAILERLAAEDPPGNDAAKAAAQAKAAARLADRVQITSALLEQENGYWISAACETPDDPEENCCSFDQCRETFGEDEDAAGPGRDFPIREAYEDRLVLDPQGSLLRLAKCCFPGFVTYNVRPGDQWTVRGDRSGFLHGMVADPVTQVCRPTCDPVKARMNGRALRTPNELRNAAVPDGAPTAFLNPTLRFVVVDGANTSSTLQDDPNRPLRDMVFRFRTAGAFTPLTVTLLRDTNEIAPIGLSFIPATAELAITDGALQGLLTVSLSDVDTARQFF